MKIIRRSIALLAIGVLAAGPGIAKEEKPLTDSDVVDMIRAGVPADSVLLAIRSEPGDYDVSASGLIALSRGGAGHEIISAIIEIHAKSDEHAQAAPPPSKSAEPSASDGAAPSGANDLTELGGVCLIDGEKRIQLKAHTDISIRPTFSFGVSGMVRVLSAIPGTKAPARTKNPRPKIEFLMPGGVQASGLVELFAADVKPDHREFPMVIKKITVIPGNSARKFTLSEDKTYSSPLGIKKYDLILQENLAPGEYITSIMGLTYDFGVDKNAGYWP
jgi:hypothetical protein